MWLSCHGYNVIVAFWLPSLESDHELVSCTSTSCFAHSSCSECTTSGCLWCPSLRQCVHLNGYPYTYIYGQCLGWVNGQSVACPGEQREGLCMLESQQISGSTWYPFYKTSNRCHQATHNVLLAHFEYPECILLSRNNLILNVLRVSATFCIRASSYSSETALVNTLRFLTMLDILLNFHL